MSLEACHPASSMNMTPEPLTFDFIYGIGSGGLSPLEIKLSGKREGDEVLIPMTVEEVPAFFQHLLPPPLNLRDQGAGFTLKARIESVSEPDPREVIRAMAEAAECGSDCCGH